MRQVLIGTPPVIVHEAITHGTPGSSLDTLLRVIVDPLIVTWSNSLLVQVVEETLLPLPSLQLVRVDPSHTELLMVLPVLVQGLSAETGQRIICHRNISYS